MERSNGCQKRRVEHIVRGALAPLLVAGSAPLASRDAGEHAADKYKAGQGRMTRHLRENGDCSTHEHIERARSARMTLQKRGLGGLTWRQEGVDVEGEAPPSAVVEGSSAAPTTPPPRWPTSPQSAHLRSTLPQLGAHAPASSARAFALQPCRAAFLPVARRCRTRPALKVCVIGRLCLPRPRCRRHSSRRRGARHCEDARLLTHEVMLPS